MLFCWLQQRQIVSHFEFDDLDLNYTPWLPADRDAAVLDVGCGPGRVLAFLAARGYRRIEGFDRDADAVRVAQVRVTAPVTIEHDWARFLEGRSGTFDLIVLKDVIYYLPRAEVVDALRVVRQALRPGGRVVVEAFNGAAYTGPFVAYKDDGILWIPTEHILASFLRRAGFSAVSVHAHVPPSRTLKRRLFNLLARAWRVVLRTVYVLERGLAEENPRILTTRLVAVGEVPA